MNSSVDSEEEVWKNRGFMSELSQKKSASSTDVEAALPLMRDNVEANGGIVGGRVECKRLEWGTEDVGEDRRAGVASTPPRTLNLTPHPLAPQRSP